MRYRELERGEKINEGDECYFRGGWEPISDPQNLPYFTGDPIRYRRPVKEVYACEICGKPVYDYTPEYCCAGSYGGIVDCACMGRPIEPCVCSEECEQALLAGIGKPMEQRRKDAGIELYNPLSNDEYITA